MIRILAYALGAIVAALATATISERLFSFESAETVIIFGAVMGAINAFIRPVVQLLSLPLSCLTFGLFGFVINAALFWLGGYLVPGIEVDWVGALVGSIIATLATGMLFAVLDE